MKTTVLGKTGLQVSRIGFGGIPIQRLTEDEAVRVVRRCLDLGVTFLDTANGYSTSESCIGKAIAGRRERLVLATKSAARDAATARQHLELSLERLGVEAIDLWQLHNVSTAEDYDQVLADGGALEAAEWALDTGIVKHIGATSHSMKVALDMVSSGHFETIQFPFNFVTDEAAQELLPLVREHDMGFIAMKPMAGGMLDNATLAIKYLLQFDGVVPDPGIERVQEIEEIASIVEGTWTMASEELAEIERIRKEVGTRFCRRCGYCEPCSQGVHISMVMNIPSFLKRLPVERLTDGQLGDGIATGRDCIECGECEGKCPYHLPIREMLHQHMDMLEQAVS